MTDADELAVAVVVATYNRANRLERLVRSLAAQQTSCRYEVIIVNDASTDDTATRLDALAAQHPGLVRCVHLCENGGPARARNRGWRTSSAPLVLFTDDDCVPSAGWIEVMRESLTTADVVQGRTEPDRQQAEREGPFSHTMDVDRLTGFYETCNVGYQRWVLDATSGFDETFRRPYCEDADLGLRAIERGARTMFVRQAVVRHDVERSSVIARIRMTARLEGVVQGIARHPDMRSVLSNRLFFRPSHPYAALAVVGLLTAALTRRGSASVATVAVAPYCWHRLRGTADGPSRLTRISALPGMLLLDVAEVSVLARWSLRHRTLVL